MIRILNVEPEGYSDEARAVLAGLGELVEEELDRSALLDRLPEVDVLIVRLGHKIDGEAIDAGTRLRVVVTATTGLDHVDHDYAAARGVAVLSLRGETEFLRTIHATAEHTWALLLALARRLPAAVASVLDGEWDRDRFRGRELAGKRLGIVGLGRLGRRVARYARAFDMDTSAYDPDPEARAEDVRSAPTLRHLLRRADVVTLHLPLNSATHHLIGRVELAELKRGALLINTARGALVDPAALVDALETGRLGGAALDVVEDEHDDAKRRASPLLAYARAHDNLILTPHVGGATHDSMARTELFMARKLERYLRGEEVRTA